MSRKKTLIRSETLGANNQRHQRSVVAWKPRDTRTTVRPRVGILRCNDTGVWHAFVLQPVSVAKRVLGAASRVVATVEQAVQDGLDLGVFRSTDGIVEALRNDLTERREGLVFSHGTP